MSEAEPKRKRIDEEEVSTADLAGAGTDSATDRRANRASPEDVIDVEPQEHKVQAVEVQKTELNSRTVPIKQVGETGDASDPTNEASSQSSSQLSNQSRDRCEEADREPLFPSDEVTNFRARWEAIQVSFVDEPRRSVQEADGLVAATMKRLAEQFAAERTSLESQWDRGSDISTEDLRIILRRYHSFFSRLLSI